MVRSSAFNLSVFYILLGIAALASFALPLWYGWETMLQEGRVETLNEDTQRFAEVFRRRGPTGLAEFLGERVSMQIAAERILLFTDPDYKPLAGNIDEWPKRLPRDDGTYTIRMEVDGEQIHAFVQRMDLPGGYNLLVGRDVTKLRPLEMRFWNSLGGAIAVLSVVGLVGGLIIRRAILSRIDIINQMTSRIVQGDLSHRLPTGRRDDEFNALSQMINRMLEQIEQLVHGVRNVSNSIAHDLRTPLAELRSRLEELAVTRPPQEETFAEIDGAVTDVDRVIGIFNALLRLAEIDTGARRSGFVSVDVTDVAAQAVEFYQPAAEIKGLALLFHENHGAQILGDPVLLAQAIGNLIDNALKFVPEQGTITVATRALPGGGAEISVADDGPGIPDDKKQRVTERFYRGDAGRNTPGVGLGLSLVSAVAKLHMGSLELTDNDPGLKVRLILNVGATLEPAKALSSMPLLQEAVGTA